MELPMFRKILFILLFPTLLWGQTYYIDYTTGDDTNTGLTTGTAWKNVHICLSTNTGNKWSLIGAGDSVLLKKGESWSPTIAYALIRPPARKSGTAGDSIYIGAYGTGARPIVSCVNSPTQDALYLRAVKYFIVDGIEFRGHITWYTTLTADSIMQHFRFTDNYVDFQYSTNDGILHYAGQLEVGAENWNLSHLRYADIGNNYIMNTVSGTMPVGIYIQGGHKLWIHHNTIIGTETCLDIAEGDSITIEYNHMVSTAGLGMKLQAQRHTLDYLVVRGNLVRGVEAAAHMPLVLYQARFAKVYNNTFIARKGNIGTTNNYALTIGWRTSTPAYWTGDGTYGLDGCFIANNIFFGGVQINTAEPGKIRYYGETDTVYLWWNQDSLRKHNAWRNNVYFRDTSGTDTRRIRENTFNAVVYSVSPGVYSNSGTETASDYASSSNLATIWDGASLTDSTSGSIVTNPLLVNLNGSNISDFTPNADSPCDSAGYAIAEWTEDILGRAINQAAITIGAISISDTTIPPHYDYGKKIILKNR